ncbi:hypothetical protein LCGC14_1148050 [marine sediment metagenome]|uniref:Uncharacterized protein n=1 Tax=marine sediment metagenome TaxID=412755 RepID=A0A0F9MJK6_9ZZZZ
MIEFFTTDLGFGWALWEILLFISIVISASATVYWRIKEEKQQPENQADEPEV